MVWYRIVYYIILHYIVLACRFANISPRPNRILYYITLHCISMQICKHLTSARPAAALCPDFMRLHWRLELLLLRLRGCTFSLASSSSLAPARGLHTTCDFITYISCRCWCKGDPSEQGGHARCRDLDRPRRGGWALSLMAESMASAELGRAPVTYHDPSGRCFRAYTATNVTRRQAR
jgi:hypothetical protein